MAMRKFYDISFSGFCTEIEAKDEKDAWNQVRDYLQNYCWKTITLKRQEEIPINVQISAAMVKEELERRRKR